MTETEAKDAIRQFICENFLFDEPFTLGDEDSLLENGVIDSAGVLTLVVFLEEHFSISIDDDDVDPENLDSLARLTRFVTSKAG